MTSCKKIRNIKREVCIGALDRLIDIDTRAIQPPQFGSVDYGENFTLSHRVWANLTTEDRVTEFDNSNTERLVTHRFIVRFLSDITAQSWIRFDNKFFNIIRTENLEHRNEFLMLVCDQRGLDTQQSNFA